MVNTRDEFIVELHAQLDQLEEQVAALTLELNNAHEQLHFQQAQQDVPPDVMDVDGEDEPEEI
jgi:uncharacterized coiled-coil protein SlyX